VLLLLLLLLLLLPWPPPPPCNPIFHVTQLFVQGCCRVRRHRNASPVEQGCPAAVDGSSQAIGT
jgi:hypothetical protein